MAASSSYSLAEIHESDKYEVFISFRGYDVRRGFLSHLYPALKAKQIHAFIDNDLERGRDITGNLFQIIEQSDLSIVIFSQNYPKSEWCLEELEKIHESMKQRKQIVVPIFYEVDPSDVQDLKGNYAIQLQKWRDSLVEISNLSGYDSRNSINDAKLIEDIVVSVSTKLKEICPSISHDGGLFGIDSSIKDVESLLSLDSANDVRMVGIWGMGGIGKTTIASKVFDRIKKKFGGQCYVSNVRETLSARDGLISLRDKIICQLLGDKDIKLNSSFSVDDSIRRRLKRIGALLVLDDVHTCTQLNSILEASGLHSPESFCPGSRIIVTSRDSQVLRDVKLKSDIYEAKELKDIEALHLLCWHAFGQNNPPQGYEKLAEKVVRYAHGVPLVLTVLGSELKRKSSSQWEDALKKFNTISPFEIQKILRISFDVLDQDEKKIFLDIACFLKGRKRDYVVNVLEAFGFHAKIGIDRLIDKSLLKEERVVREQGLIITMHDLLEQMGQEIVAGDKESREQRSRLWTFEDIKDALTNNKGTENVEAISIGYPRGDGDKIDISHNAFIHMSKLRFLSLANQHINCPMGLEFLPDSIKHLSWDYYPLNYWPSNYNPEKLVHLCSYSSQLKEIKWTKPLMNLKSINLAESYNLIKISDLAMAPNLEKLVLKGCESLVEVGSSLENLNKLTLLDVEECISLSILPELPSSIKQLELQWSGIRRLPSTIGRLTHLKNLPLKYCERLESLPSSISSLSSLEKISLHICTNLQKLPEDFGNLESLKELDASFSGLRELPPCIQNLKKLIILDLRGCPYLNKLPEDFGNLESLKKLDASYSGLRELPPSIQNLKKLIKLELCGCRDLNKLPEDFGNLESLEELDASDSGLRELPPSIPNLKNLLKLDLTCCKELQSLPALPSNLEVFYARESLLNEVSSSILDHYFLKAHYQPTKVHRFCVTGSQVPEWMMYRNECGSSVSLELETFGDSTNFIFCSVFSSNCNQGGFGYLKLAAILQSGEILETEHCFDYGNQQLRQHCFVNGSLEEACDVFLWNCNLDHKFVKKVSYKITTESHCKHGKIIKCGVHPIFHNKNN